MLRGWWSVLFPNPASSQFRVLTKMPPFDIQFHLCKCSPAFPVFHQLCSSSSTMIRTHMPSLPSSNATVLHSVLLLALDVSRLYHHMWIQIASRCAVLCKPYSSTLHICCPQSSDCYQVVSTRQEDLCSAGSMATSFVQPPAPTDSICVPTDMPPRDISPLELSTFC
jgi:hypothetical protein